MRKLGRKLTSTLLALALFASVLPIGVAPAQAEGQTIKINSDLDLWKFAYELSKNTAGYANANVSLEQDIDLGNAAWVPIGTDIRPGMPAIDFTGTFDGNGHTINSINIVDKVKLNNPDPNAYQSSSDVGLFARLGSGGIVKNLKVTGSVNGGEMGVNVGGIVGANNGGTITNCTFSGNVSGGSAMNVGGIVGQNNSSVTDCTNSGSVSGGSNVGGIVGQNGGGVTDCSNTVGLSISGSGTFGGVVGRNEQGAVENCSNSGSFSMSPSDPLASGTVGGVVGINFNNSSITNCYSTGNIGDNIIPIFNSTIGGVVGENAANSSVTGCYSSGKFGKSLNGTVGGVIGNNGATVTGCYFLQTENVEGVGKGDGTSTDVYDKTIDRFNSGEVAWLLESGQPVEQTEPVWGQNNLKAETSLPALIALDDSAETVYQVTVDYGDYADAPPDEISYTNTVTAPTTVPTRDDYIFVDWQMTEGEGNTITFTPQWRNSLGITAPIFESVTEGYAQPAAQPLTITNNDSSDETISSVALSDETAFTLNKTDGATIAAGTTDNTTYTIQPAAGLSAGTYEATVTVTYSENITVTTAVSFTVQPAPEPEPEPTPEPDPTPTPMPDPEPTPEGPSTEGSAGWEDIAGEIEDAEEGDEITIDMGDETKVPAEIFESVAGKDVDVTFDLGDVQWTVNGADIPADADLSDLDLGVALDTDGIPANVVNAITGEVGTVQITLAHDGEFGFTMTLSAPLGEENAGYWANLYHYDEEAEALQFEAAAEIDEDGNVKIPFSHASQYAIVIDTHSHATVDVSDIFIDVAPNAWYKDAVQYAYDNGLMTGISDTEFAPEATTTRAMIVSILARLENVTSAESAGFNDVTDEWYATAVNWAASVGVVNGYEDGTFRPNQPITREQLAAILMNYVSYKGEDVSARASLDAYSDAENVSTWATDTMSWAVAEGYITGMTADTLQPQGSATRAQVAAILERFLAQ